MLKLLFENNKNEKIKVDEKGNIVTVKPWPIDSKPNHDPWSRHSQLNK